MHMKFATEIPKQTRFYALETMLPTQSRNRKINMATRRPFWKSIGSYPCTQVLGHWSFEFIFKAKLQWESENINIQYGHQAAILKVASLKINRHLPMATIYIHMKFEIEIPKQIWLTLRKPCHLQSPETENSNMAARRPFWKLRHWKSIGSYPYS